MLHWVLITKEILEVLVVILVYVFVACVGYFVWNNICSCYRNRETKRRIRQLERDYEEFLQRQHKRRVERELHRKERERYPLFYWRELIEEKLEDGNF